MNCNFCNNTFSSKYVLNNHQKRAKYCIDIQKKNGSLPIYDLYKCEFCDIEVAKNTKDRHLKSCRKRTEKIIEEKDIKIYMLEKDLAVKNKELEEVYKQLEVYKHQLYEDDKFIKEIAKQPRNQTNQTTNTQNNLINMTPLDISEAGFSQCIQDKFTKNYLLNGQKGAARFAVDNLLKDSDGKLKYVCTDPSRQIYRFKTLTGDLERDVKAKKLTKALVDNLTKKSHNISVGEIDGGDADIFVVYTSNFQDIRDLSDDNGEFRAELASLTTV